MVAASLIRFTIWSIYPEFHLSVFHCKGKEKNPYQSGIFISSLSWLSPSAFNGHLSPSWASSSDRLECLILVAVYRKQLFRQELFFLFKVHSTFLCFSVFHICLPTSQGLVVVPNVPQKVFFSNAICSSSVPFHAVPANFVRFCSQGRNKRREEEEEKAKMAPNPRGQMAPIINVQMAPRLSGQMALY